MNKLAYFTIALAAWAACAHEERSEEASGPVGLVRTRIHLDRADLKPMPFISRHFGANDWQGTLAMNIAYDPVLAIRQKIEASLYGNKKLQYLTSWEASGEAHVTVITPVEYQECMWSDKRSVNVLHMSDIEKIALSNDIQSSDLAILGMGFGRKTFPDRSSPDETHFIIVSSENLLKIRRLVHKKFLKNGGDMGCWDPELFFPHITVGYTYKDIHFPDIKKNLIGSQDPRFELAIH